MNLPKDRRAALPRIAFLVVAALVGAVSADANSPDDTPRGNLVTNPSAEQAATDGTPADWGLYVGAGQLKITAATEQKHSGERSACLEIVELYSPNGDAAHRTVNGGIVLAPNNDYQAAGAMPCNPGDVYAFSFWYQGDVPNAAVSVTGWPSAEADLTTRVPIPCDIGRLAVGPQWRQCAGKFRIPEGVHRFAVAVCLSGGDAEGFQVGKRLYVDDVEILARAYPDGELRAIWGPFPESNEREEGVRQIASSLDKIKAGGFNTLFLWTQSQYVAALDRPELQKDEPQAAWDALAEVIRAAEQRGIQVHAWYSPWIYKNKGYHANELKDHPEWAAVSAEGVADPDGLCFVRPEVRQYELDLLAKLIDRYPGLAGIHIEEPGFNWGNSYCYCDYCRKFCRETLGIDIHADPAATKPATQSLAAFMCTDFVIRLRGTMAGKRPDMRLSANGGSNDAEWAIGRNWATWARRGLIDFYVPQLYTKDVATFVRMGQEAKSSLGACDLVTGMAVSWSGIYPEVQTPEVIAAEIAASRKLGAKGFAVYFVPFLRDEHYQGIRNAIGQGR